MAVQTLPLLLVTPGTLQTLACLVGGTPLLATPGVVLEAICEWFWGLQSEPLLLCAPSPQEHPEQAVCPAARMPPPLSSLRKGSGGTVAASGTSFNKSVLVHNHLALFTPLAGHNKSF